MEIEIESKRNNPLLNRTEVYFTIKHDDSGTPNREIIKSELADKLNAKKDGIIVDYIKSSFGIQKTRGYAKVYSSTKKLEEIEKKYKINRNKITKKEQKSQEPEKKEEKPAESDETKKEEEKTEQQKEDEKKEQSQPEEKTKESDDAKKDEKPDEKKEEKNEDDKKE